MRSSSRARDALRVPTATSRASGIRRIAGRNPFSAMRPKPTTPKFTSVHPEARQQAARLHVEEVVEVQEPLELVQAHPRVPRDLEIGLLLVVQDHKIGRAHV